MGYDKNEEVQRLPHNRGRPRPKTQTEQVTIQGSWSCLEPYCSYELGLNDLVTYTKGK